MDRGFYLTLLFQKEFIEIYKNNEDVRCDTQMILIGEYYIN